MPHWNPEAKWKNKEVFIIGGGDSLRGFDWSLLKNERTIGCNDAYRLGERTCKICVFGDAPWFRKNKWELTEFKGIVFTNSSQLLHTRITWLWTMPRQAFGLGEKALAWNNSTGAVAVNLALILGAKKIFLLGFDMRRSEQGNNNWHNKSRISPSKKAYKKFLVGFSRLKAALEKSNFECEIVNVTDDSNLDLFPKIKCKEFWKQRKEKK